jgi:glycogen debranching enzyme
MTLLAEPALAQGVLETLARFQGTDTNDDTEEEPGKILHEMRFGASARPRSAPARCTRLDRARLRSS